MSKVFVISDMHFGHANIINFCNRPFKDVKEMNEALVENWNRVVDKDDLVYNLGDVYFGDQNEAQHYLSALKGRKRLVLGNHDHAKSPVLYRYFEKIQMWYQVGNMVMTHAPLHPETWEMKERGMTNLYGHTHLLKMTGDNYVNVCVEHINYTPIELTFA